MLFYELFVRKYNILSFDFFNKNLLIKTFLIVWSVSNSLLTQKLPRKAKVAAGCSQYKKFLKTLKVAQKLPSTIYLCLLLRPRNRIFRNDSIMNIRSLHAL